MTKKEDFIDLYDFRTGACRVYEGEVFSENDGPNFIGFSKCVRHPDGHLVIQGATTKEYENRHKTQVIWT